MPRPLWVLLRRGWTYLRRLRYWWLVLAEVRGDGAADTAKLYLSALAGPVTSLGRLDEWRNPVPLFDMVVRIGKADRFFCRRALDDLWHVLPSGQATVRAALNKHLTPGGVFVDAGANIGTFTVMGARGVGPDGTVVAFEMMPDTAARLREHLRMNGLDHVRVVEAALSDASGQEVVAAMPARLTGQASIVHAGDAGGDWIEVRVRTTTLDEALAGLGEIDVMKMDLEGAEALALAGGRAVLARTRCLIFEDRGGGTRPSAAAAIASEAGLKVSRLDGNNMIALR